MSGGVQSILELVGHTPVVRLRRIAPAGASLHLKLELSNPSGSLKDRVARAAVDAALADGSLAAGQTLVEATRGNSALALAQACASRGVKLVAVMPDAASVERRQLLRAYGVKVVLVPVEDGFGAAQARAEALVKETAGAVQLDAFAPLKAQQ